MRFELQMEIRKVRHEIAKLDFLLSHRKELERHKESLETLLREFLQSKAA